MFLVDKAGTIATEVHEVEITLTYCEGIKRKADEIYNGVMERPYKYGSTKNARIEADIRVRQYLQNKEKIARIIVNGDMNFGDYEEPQGYIVFEKIIDAIKSNENFLDMRGIKVSEK